MIEERMSGMLVHAPYSIDAWNEYRNLPSSDVQALLAVLEPDVDKMWRRNLEPPFMRLREAFDAVREDPDSDELNEAADLLYDEFETRETELGWDELLGRVTALQNLLRYRSTHPSVAKIGTWADLRETDRRALSAGEYYADESPQFDLFRSNAIWPPYGRFIVNRYLELQEKVATNRKAISRAEAAKEIGVALSDAHGLDTSDFAGKQLARILRFHENGRFR